MMTKEKTNNFMSGLFSKIEPTPLNLQSIAEFNRIVKNYLKMKEIEIKNPTTV
jgi:hypothetical protein